MEGQSAIIYLPYLAFQADFVSLFDSCNPLRSFGKLNGKPKPNRYGLLLDSRLRDPQWKTYHPSPHPPSSPLPQITGYFDRTRGSCHWLGHFPRRSTASLVRKFVASLDVRSQPADPLSQVLVTVLTFLWYRVHHEYGTPHIYWSRA